jgi:hypothetical protein
MKSRLLRTAASRTAASRTAASRTAARAAILCAGLICAGLIGCSSSPPPAFNPGGPASAASATAVAQSSGPGSVVMPPFGKDAHVVMTDFLPPDAEMARAVVADKDYELAFLYAEYTGGRSDDWTAYVSRTMEMQVNALLAKPDVTTESFRGTIKIFDMRVIADPAIKGNLDVSACFDNARAVNTDLNSGAVLPGQTVTNDNYYRFTDELARSSDGQWQVISNYPIVYYPQAKECKP